MEGHMNSEDKGVSVIVCASKYDFANNIFDNYSRQDFMKKELIIMVRDELDDFDKWIDRSERYPLTRVYQQDRIKSNDECLNYCMEQSIFDYIAIFEENYHYDSDYLTSSIREFEKSNNTVHNQLFKNTFQISADSK